MVSMFWVHYKRKADGQEFHEQLTTAGMMKLLAQGGIVLCGVEVVDKYGKETKACAKT